jgi:ketol-acid reductoisomerase
MIALIGSFKPAKFMMRLTIIGYGNQAKAWAHNLKDSGFPIRVALKPESPSMERAVLAGFEVVEIGSDEFFTDRAYALLTPDNTHQELMTNYAHRLPEGSFILYAHGYSLLKHHFQQRFPHLQHVLFAPKSIGSELRRQYELKGKLGAVYSLEYLKAPTDEIQNWLKDLAIALGINMGPYPTSFARETNADLYSEQGLLCSLIPYAAGEMFAHLVKAGIEPELAYFECWHELKLIVNAMVDKGPEGFFDLISPNALIGSEKGYQRLFTDEFRGNLKGLLDDIESGKFDQELDAAQVEELRKTIRSRWQQAPLTKTFNQINQGQHEKT